jgi:hypothetical protein
MPSFFRTEDLDVLLTRIRSVRADSPRAWGKMDPAQMLAHCQVPIRVALGETRLRRGLMGFLFGRIGKKQLMGPKPTPRGLPTDPAFRVTDARDLAKERDALVVLVERLGRGGPGLLTKEAHPFFGRMTTEEWDTLMWKHLDHHLRQFGA